MLDDLLFLAIKKKARHCAGLFRFVGLVGAKRGVNRDIAYEGDDFSFVLEWNACYRAQLQAMHWFNKAAPRAVVGERAVFYQVLVSSFSRLPFTAVEERDIQMTGAIATPANAEVLVFHVDHSWLPQEQKPLMFSRRW